MADENIIPPKISEISIGGKTYEIVDLQMRRTFMKYYDKLHGPYGSITGVLAGDHHFFHIPKKYIKVNNTYLAFIIGLDAKETSDYWATYIIIRTGSSNGIITRIPLNVGSKVSTDFSSNNTNRFGINFGPYDAEIPMTFWGEARSSVFGFIRLNTFNSYAQHTFPDDFRQDTWSKITGRIGGMTDADLDLK